MKFSTQEELTMLNLFQHLMRIQIGDPETSSG